MFIAARGNDDCSVCNVIHKTIINNYQPFK